MRAGLTDRARTARLRSGEESGAVAVIVALSLIAIFSMLVLVVDVGGLLLARRAMVNASDAAALAAAQSCASAEDTLDPEAQADTYAADNVATAVTGTTNITEIVGCDDEGNGHVSVEYLTQQDLFFAGVLGFGNTGDVRTAATAAWGAAAGGFAVPIVLESGYLQGTCQIPDGVTIGDTCAMYYNNGDSSLGEANWGFMNLEQWNVDSGENCHNPGSNDRGDWILNDYGDPLVLNGAPPGSEPTYVCNDTGHSTANWQNLVDRMSVNSIVLFPVNDCEGQLDKSGSVSPCPSTPDKYDIIGFTRLKLIEVYKGNDAAAIGTPGTGGTCTLANASLTSGQVKPLSDTYGSGGGCPSGSPDNLNASDVHIFPKESSDPEYRQCVPGDLSPSCGYWYDSVARQITWRSANATGLKVQYGWSMNGTEGACGSRPSDPNAICILTEWKGFTTSSGPIGSGKNFGVSAFALCDLGLGTCPEES
ncbi:MAG: pilus assembly protein TadG-related protein [Actinomycetota bacterium]